MNVVTVADAISRISDSFSPTRHTENWTLLRSLGHVSAGDLYSPELLPAFDRSTVDGFAVRAQDTFGAAAAQPSYCTLVGQVAMGEAAEIEIGPGQAVAIATGGCLPKAADAVVMLEDTTELPDGSIEIARSVAPGENLIRAGEDVAHGACVLSAGTTIRPQDIGLCAAVGITEIEVQMPLRMGILSTGIEIVPADTTNVPFGKVRDVNAYAVAGLAQVAGIETELLGLAGDNADAIYHKVAEGLKRNDVVVLSGGSSVGTRDHTEEVLSRLGGFELLFHGISVKPGKPTLAACNGPKLVVGLPGHPASALVAFDAVVLPALDAQLRSRITCTARLSANISSSPGREEYVRVKLRSDAECNWADPVYGKSGILSTITRSNGYVMVPLESNGIEQGTKVEVIRYRGCI